MIKCQNSIVTVNVRSAHRQLQHKPSVALRSLLQPWSLWQVAPDNLKRFLEFGAYFQLCFRLAVSLQHCTSIRDSPLYIRRIWRPLVFCDDIWTAGPQPVLPALRAVCADAPGAPSYWKMNPVGSRRLLWRNDNLLLFIKTLLWRHPQ